MYFIIRRTFGNGWWSTQSFRVKYNVRDSTHLVAESDEIATSEGLTAPSK